MITTVTTFVLFASSLLILSTSASLVMFNVFASSATLKSFEQETRVLIIMFTLGVVLFLMTLYAASL